MSWHYYRPDSEDEQSVSDDAPSVSPGPSPGSTSQMKQFDRAWFKSTSDSPSDLDGVSTAGYNVPSSEFDTVTTDSYDVDEYESTVDPIPPERAKLTVEHGRRFHTFDKGIYHLPADEEEWDRLGVFVNHLLLSG